MGKYNRKDRLYEKAKSGGFRSRASYKLEELDKKYRVFKKGIRVLDLGAFPGGWVQVALGKVGPSGKVFGVDLREIELKGLEAATIIIGDLREEAFQASLLQEIQEVDLILSDLSPQLTGVSFRDDANLAELLGIVFLMAERLLKPGGSLLTKTFPGPDSDAMLAANAKSFSSMTRTNLSSSRNSSDEQYAVFKGFVKRQS